jgi:hypothetical protein
MISEWLTNGDLPPGVHFATWREIEARLAFNPRRQKLLAGFRRACQQLRKAGCRLVYLDGSFVTRKEHPGDFDACWDVQNVDDTKLDPLFWDFSRGARRRTAVSGRVLPGATAGRSDRQGVSSFLPGEQAEWRAEGDSGNPPERG